LFRFLNLNLHTIEELLHPEFPKGDDAEKNLPWSMLKIWEHQTDRLREISASALRNGDVLIAAEFRERATRIEGWMSNLTSLMSRRASATDLPDQGWARSASARLKHFSPPFRAVMDHFGQDTLFAPKASELMRPPENRKKIGPPQSGHG